MILEDLLEHATFSLYLEEMQRAKANIRPYFEKGEKVEKGARLPTVFQVFYKQGY